MNTERHIIFLDIDGVLCLSTPDISQVHVANLKKIQDATDARIILSSMWRMHKEDRYTVLTALSEGDVLWDIFDFTLYRGWEGKWPDRDQDIRRWVVEHEGEVDRWVALDDDTACESLGEHWIQCHFPPIKPVMVGGTLGTIGEEDDKYGLTPELADAAIKYLNQTVT